MKNVAYLIVSVTDAASCWNKVK